jgi:hypothetical protein
MIWLIGHDLDYEKAKELQQFRCPLVELTALVKDQHGKWHDESIKETSVELVKNLPEPRYVRSHLPWGLLPHQFVGKDGKVKPRVCTYFI